ncbi:lasso peptide biosynthesis B2 protein [Streptomyces sp. NPDC048383]|uniref:lasso peptide biosynthesis B2 protein n=1 Tax=Streptomyces sp. NPDC048383 TaxID=3155386 RepID=UPI003418DAEC
MSLTTALPRDRGARLPLRRRLWIRTLVGAARLLVLLAPHRLRRALTFLSRGAAPATAAQALRARGAVLEASLAMNGMRSCLPRSVAVALLCRSRGVWPTWCVGVRAAPPFTAHAWVEAEGGLVGEKGRYESWSRLITVGPHQGRRSRRGPAASSDRDGATSAGS